VTTETQEAKFKIDSFDDFKRVMTIARGGDPDAIQAITRFMDFGSNAERSYFPDKVATLCVSQLNGFGKVFYPNTDWDPFLLTADVISIGFMGYKGFKSNQFVDMTRTQPDLSGIQTTQEEAKRGLLNRILNRGNKE